MNPIYIEYYSHEGCDCFKIDLPWTNYHNATEVLCPASEGIKLAKLLAVGVIQKHLAEVLENEQPNTKETHEQSE